MGVHCNCWNTEGDDAACEIELEPGGSGIKLPEWYDADLSRSVGLGSASGIGSSVRSAIDQAGDARAAAGPTCDAGPQGEQTPRGCAR